MNLQSTTKCNFIITKGPRKGSYCNCNTHHNRNFCLNHINSKQKLGQGGFAPGHIVIQIEKQEDTVFNWFYDFLPYDIQDYILKIPYVYDCLKYQNVLIEFLPLEFLRFHFIKLNQLHCVNPKRPYDESKLLNHWCDWFIKQPRELMKIIWKKYDIFGRNQEWDKWFIDYDSSIQELYEEKNLECEEASFPYFESEKNLYLMPLEYLKKTHHTSQKLLNTYVEIINVISKYRPITDNVTFNQIIDSLATIFVEKHGVLIERICKYSDCNMVTKKNSGYCPYHCSPATRINEKPIV